ncbi:MAG: hypothetical protein IT306_13410 [Chloroflexi bacterium]|nr:hypothetical protein [Chloroflexota bacterium]
MSVAQAPGSDPRAAFLLEIGAVRQRLWLERAGVLVTRGLMLGFLLTLILAAGGWFLKFTVPPLWYAVPLLVPMLLGGLISLLYYPSVTTAALIIDRRLELAEQLATAAELITEGSDEPVAWAQVETAAEAAAWAQENWRGGPRLGRDLALTAVLGFLAAAALLLTGPDGRSLIPRQLTPQQEEVAQVQPSSQTGAKPTQPPAAQPSPQAQPQGRTGGVQRAVQEIKRSREGGGLDASEASRRLGQAEAELSRLTGQSNTDQQSLGRLAQALDQIAAGHQAAEALRRGDYEQAARSIAELGAESDQLSQEAKSQLAQALRQAANDSAASPELSQAERKAADALTGRDYEQAARAMSDLADQVTTRGRNVIPQAEQNRAWDAVNQERRAQGQPDSPGSARNQQQGQQGRGQQGQQGQQQNQGQQGQNGQSQQPQNGQGIGTAPSTGGPPGEQQADGEPAPRLEAQGKPVEVDLKPNEKPGARPGDADQPDDKPRDDAGAIRSSSSAAPGQVTSSAPPEMNFVPSGRRDIVREYFQGPGEARPQP